MVGIRPYPSSSASSSSSPPRRRANSASRSSTVSRAFASPARRGRSAPRAASAAGRRRLSACCMLWVTISVVSRSSATSRRGEVQHELGRARVEGRRVLVEQQDLGGRHGRHQQRHRLPLAAREQAHPVAEPALQPEAEVRPAARASAPGRRRSPPAPSPGARPRASASARFSSMVSAAQVPASGSWNTRASSRARAAAAAARVTSAPSMTIRPAAGAHRPGQHVQQRRLAGPVAADDGDELAFRDDEVDRRAGPASRAPCPAWKTTSTPSSSIIAPAPAAASSLARVAGRISAAADQQGGDQVEVGGLQPEEVGLERQRHHDPVEHRAQQAAHHGREHRRRAAAASRRRSRRRARPRSCRCRA